jgi:carboxymethylenebutenolidase
MTFRDASLSRRRFLAAGLSTGIAGITLRRIGTAGEPFLRKSLHDPAIIHGPATFASGGQLIRAHAARPARGGRHRLVLVNHGNTGLPEDVVAALARLAQLGYVAIAYDNDTRSGGAPGSMVHVIDHYRSRVFADQVLKDNAAAISFARAQAYTDVAGGVGMLGFCGGGWSVLRQATQTPDVRAVVALYAAPAFPPERTNHADPRPNLVEFIDDVHAPMQFHYGTVDSLIPVAQARELEARLRGRGARADVFYYEDAGHAFCDYVHRDYYNEGAARLAYERIEAFLARHYPA